MSNSLYDYAEMANLCDTNGVIRRKIVKRYSSLPHNKRSKCKIPAHYNPLINQKASCNLLHDQTGQLVDSFKTPTIHLT